MPVAVMRCNSGEPVMLLKGQRPESVETFVPGLVPLLTNCLASNQPHHLSLGLGFSAIQNGMRDRGPTINMLLLSNIGQTIHALQSFIYTL